MFLFSNSFFQNQTKHQKIRSAVISNLYSATASRNSSIKKKENRDSPNNRFAKTAKLRFTEAIDESDSRSDQGMPVSDILYRSRFTCKLTFFPGTGQRSPQKVHRIRL